MTLRLPDKWVWDFWLVQDGKDYHAFYLQAPRSLGNPDLRHLNACVGHAASTDATATKRCGGQFKPPRHQGRWRCWRWMSVKVPGR